MSKKDDIKNQAQAQKIIDPFTIDPLTYEYNEMDKETPHYHSWPNFYWLAEWFFENIAGNTWFSGINVSHEETVPDKGPVVLFYNHVSNWDPGMVGVAVNNRRFNFPAKKELFQYHSRKARLVSQVLSWVGSIPFDRENMVNSRDNLKYLRKLLDSGQGLAIAPEGKRHKTYFETRELLPFKQGFIKFMLSVQTQYVKKNRPPIRFYPMIINYLPNTGFRSRIVTKVGKSIPTQEYVKLMQSRQKDLACEMFSQRVRVAMERLIVNPE